MSEQGWQHAPSQWRVVVAESQGRRSPTSRSTDEVADILWMVCQGISQLAIAKMLGVSPTRMVQITRDAESHLLRFIGAYHRGEHTREIPADLCLRAHRLIGGISEPEWWCRRELAREGRPFPKDE